MPERVAIKTPEPLLRSSTKAKEIPDSNLLLKNIQNLANKIFDFFYQVYDYIFAKNPETNKRQLWILPSSLEIFLGNILYPEVIASNGGITFDFQSNENVKEVGKKLQDQAGRKLDYEFTQIRSNQVNAFCFLAGKIAIYDGIIEGMNTFKPKEYKDITKEDKIAAVLSHEIVHASAKHTSRNLEIAIITIVALLALKVYTIFKNASHSIFDSYNDRYYAQSLKISEFFVRIFSKVLMFTISKSCEYEADKYGMFLMEKAGYNPKAAIYLQEFFIAISLKRNPTLEKILTFFSTHPSAEDRLEANRRTLKEIEANRISKACA